MAESRAATATLRDLGRRVARDQARVVQRYDTAAQRYAESLQRYAEGEIGAGALGKDVLNVAVEQTARGAEDALAIGTEYSRWLWSLAGVEARDEAAEESGGQAKGKKASSGQSG